MIKVIPLVLVDRWPTLVVIAVNDNGVDGGDDDDSDTCGVGGKVGGEQALQQK